MTRACLDSLLQVTLPAGARLRPQSADDLAFLRELFVSRRWDEVSAVPGWSDAQRRAFLHNQAELQHQHYERHYPEAQWLIVEQAGQPIGRLCLHRHATEQRIVDIALLPAWHGQGLGTRLLRAILAQADAQGHNSSLSVETASRARRLYQRLGFEPIEENGLYLQMQRPAQRPVREDLDNP
ncbi:MULTISPECIES: GNAT family N-acetyltransferase [Pseudomonas]|uniref:GNAT family N-acetyltransferase n=1 Tax=Pseudomonas TaxID=286 RepID=UPI000CD27A5F|nr:MULTISPECIES: GNAT family N-acetyltransferase [Pseudomonas]POA89950.1 GNAT family N-acetyltransferase [Pseudomonas protegens]BCQ62769.1 N-acetyltransferase GCN5 [Pseudomonas sp. Boi14]